jgi:hypothetical protein
MNIETTVKWAARTRILGSVTLSYLVNNRWPLAPHRVSMLEITQLLSAQNPTSSVWWSSERGHDEIIGEIGCDLSNALLGSAH